MKNLLFLTDLNNGWADEDRMIGDYLSQYYNVKYAGVYESEQFESLADAALIHNTWPGGTVDHEMARRYRAAKQELRARLHEKGIPSFNAHNGSGDMLGKKHLLELQAKDYPVIPTAADLAGIERFSDAAEYRVKPLDAFGGHRQKNHRREELEGMDLSGCLIQPSLAFNREVQVYYVDDQYFCTAAASNKAHEDVTLIETDTRIVSLADSFRKWNSLSHGLQRIDFIERPGGELLLMEIEDDAPYFNVPLLAPGMQEKLFGMIHQSLQKNLGL